MNPTDPLQLQRLVDGECDEAELRSLLADAAHHEDGWREIATAFVEDRLWQQQFCRTAAGSGETSLLGPKQALRIQPLSRQASRIPDTRFRQPRSIRWLTMAAAMLLAVSFGYLLGTDPAKPWNDAPLAASHQRTLPVPVAKQESSPTPVPKMTPASLKADYHLQLPEAAGGTNEVALDGEIPLYYVQSPDQLTLIEEPEPNRFRLSPEILVQLTDQGFQLRQDLNFISGNLKDGRSFMIPVRTINFSPGQ